VSRAAGDTLLLIAQAILEQMPIISLDKTFHAFSINRRW
jgi:PIN domain nuclease of toxin-antitoxin system